MTIIENLDVWSPQYNSSDLNAALDGWKNEDINTCQTILFSNVKCVFKIGENILPNKQWDTFLYSPNNDKLVMLLRDGAVNVDDLRRELDKRRIVYHEVTFSKSIDSYQDDSSIPQFWPARDKSVLDEFIKDSVDNENCMHGIYYPEIKGSLIFSYQTNDNSVIPIEGRIIDGIIEMDDKIILLLKFNNIKLDSKDIIEILNNNKIDYNISYETTLSLTKYKNTLKI